MTRRVNGEGLDMVMRAAKVSHKRVSHAQQAAQDFQRVWKGTGETVPCAVNPKGGAACAVCISAAVETNQVNVYYED